MGTQRPVCLAVVALIAVTLLGRAARAEPTPDARRSPPGPSAPALGWSYLYDGGAVPFIYASAAIWYGCGRWGHPRDTPLWFSGDEGGEVRKADTVPVQVYAVTSVVIAAGIAVLRDDARFYHVKGVLQAWATAAAVTSATKLVVSRHRPHYSFDGLNTDSARLSFFSGDASSIFAQTSYFALYLRSHTFAAARGDRLLPWWEAVTYAGMLAASAYVPYSRVLDNRHHASDVLAGSLVGAGLGTVFYLWQERRYRRALRGEQDAAPGLVLMPSGGGLALAGRY